MDLLRDVDIVMDSIFNYLSNRELLRMREVSKQFQPRALRLFNRRKYTLHLQTPSFRYPDGLQAFSYFDDTMNPDQELAYDPLKYKYFSIEFDPLNLTSLVKMLANYGENINKLELRPHGFSGINVRDKLNNGGLETYIKQFFKIFEHLQNLESLDLHMDDHWLFKIPRLDTKVLDKYIHFNLPKLTQLSVFKNIPNHLTLSQMPSLQILNLYLEIENKEDISKLAAAFKFFENWNKCIITLTICVEYLNNDSLQTLNGLHKILSESPPNIKKIGLEFYEGIAGENNNLEAIAYAYQNIIFQKCHLINLLILNIPEQLSEILQMKLPSLPSIEKLEIPVSIKYTSGLSQNLFNTVKSLRFTNNHEGTIYPNIKSLTCSFEADVLSVHNLFPNLTDLTLKQCNFRQFECVIQNCPQLIKLGISIQQHDYFSRMDDWQRIISGFEHPETILFKLLTLEEIEGLTRNEAYDRLIEIRHPSLINLTKLKFFDVNFCMTEATVQLTLLEMQDFDYVAFIPYEITPITLSRLKDKCIEFVRN